MPRSTGTLVVSDFAKGFITEATPFTFPKGACTESQDCIHDVIGSVYRRNGFDLEINHSIKQIDATDNVINSYLWRDVAGDGTLTLFVKQVGNLIYFYDGSSTDPLSTQALSSTVNLEHYRVSGAPLTSTEECQFASGNGKLFVVHPFTDPLKLTFDPNTRTFTVNVVVLKMRDLVGMIDDPYGVDERPGGSFGSINSSHFYNLKNQGWTVANIATWDDGIVLANPLDPLNDITYPGRDDLPSNADVMWTFKDSLGQFSPHTIEQQVRGNSPAPKGHYIIQVCDQNRTDVSGISLPTITSGFRRPSTIAFFAGRAFYSGINVEGFSSNIYFSQIVERDEQYGWCYQANDPTSETTFDLLASDGGVIKIEEAGTIYKLISVPGGLAVFASNGVWIVTGSTGIGFTATDYTVNKISSISTLTATSFVDAAGTPLWWNLEGIYRLDAAQGGTGFQVSPITAQTIKSFFDSIPPSEKRNARGYYNPLQYVVQWVYRSTESTSLKEFYEYDRILNLDVRSGAFYVWTIPVHDIKVHGMVVLENRGGEAALVNVTANSTATVTANDSSTVQVWTIGDSIVIPSYKYIVSYNDGVNDQFTFAETNNKVDFVDWKTYDGVGVAYESYLISAYVLPNTMTSFESNYVNFFASEDSKFFVKGIWDFANSGNSGRWTNQQLVDNTTKTNYDRVIARRKIRGSGKSLQIRIDSYPNVNFNIDGWGMFITGNQEP